MAEFKFYCPHCGQHIQCDTGHSGAQIDCPTCEQAIIVPPASATLPNPQSAPRHKPVTAPSLQPSAARNQLHKLTTDKLTVAKIRVYGELDGDEARWPAETNGADSSGISKSEWKLIGELRWALNLVMRGRANPEFAQTVEPRLLNATADESARQALRELATKGSFTHPILGTIIPEIVKKDCWWTEPLTFANLGLVGQICAFTHGEPPSDAQVAAMVSSLNASPGMKQEMAEHMAGLYHDIRPDYAAAVEHYGELPVLQSPDEVWSLFSELSVFICDGSHTGEGHPISTTFSFQLSFDPDHEMNAEYRNGQFYDLVCEG